METKTLQMVFRTSQGGTMSISVPDIREDITALHVNDTMNTLIAKGAFASEKGIIIDKDAAKIITQTTTEITML
jgi:hypothetical protein